MRSEVSKLLASSLRSIDIPCARFVLDNGLRVLISNRPGPGQVGVNVCYHAGSSAESPGKSGLAHLVEHLMYAGTEHHPQSYVPALEQIGATTINADATEDFSTYFETVPAGALDLALWMEAERMGCLSRAIDQAKLEREREVIRGEILQRENEPFGGVKRLIRAHSYPAGHPYQRVALGSIEELEALTLDDVHQWLASFHSPANALLVVGGAAAPRSVIARIKHFFGALAADAAPSRHGPPPRLAPFAERKTALITHSRGGARVYKVWNIPPWTHPDHAVIELAANILAAGADSILGERLIRSRGIATQIGFEIGENELGSQLIAYADARSEALSGDLAETIDQEIARFLSSEPSPEVFDAARMALIRSALQALECLTGPKSLTRALVMSELLAANPAFFHERLTKIAEAGPDAVLSCAARWLGGSVFTLAALPSATPPLAESANARRAARPRAAVPSGKPQAWRATPCGLPSVITADALEARLPALKAMTLGNGLSLLLAERPGAATANVRMVLRSSMRAERAWRPASCGIAGFAAAMLAEGHTERRPGKINAPFRMLGAEFRGRTGLDTATLELSGLNFNLAPALELLAEITSNPRFEPGDVRPLKLRRLAEIEHEKAHPFDFALRTMPRLVFGEGHPYAQPLSGLGCSSCIEALTPGDLADFYCRWARPDRTALVVVGDLDSRSLRSAIERAFRAWGPHTGAARALAIAPDVVSGKPAAPGVIFTVNRPGQTQSAITVGWPVSSLSVADEAAFLLARALAADMFSSRLNLLLREQMNCSYGVRCLSAHAEGGGLCLIHASVRADMTGAALREVRRILAELCADSGVSTAEATRARTYVRARLVAFSESGSQTAQAAEQIVARALDADYYQQLSDRLQTVKPEEIVHAARTILNPSGATWLLAADMNVVAEQLRDQGQVIRSLESGDQHVAP